MAITLTRALKEIKVLDKRIRNKIETISFLDVRQNKFKDKALKSQKTLKDFESETRADWQSLQDLIVHRAKLKSGISHANSTTKVKVAGVEMTISEAIETKHSIQYKKSILQSMRRERSNLSGQVAKNREDLDVSINRMVEANTGKDRKIDKEDYDKIANPFIEANYLHLVDPIGVDNAIEELETYISNFESDVDIALSEVNAKTEIEI